MASRRNAKHAPPVRSLVELARAAGPPPIRRMKTWIERLPAAHRDMLLELRDEWQAGRLDGWTPRALCEEIVAPAGIEIGISVQTFRVWIARPAGGK